MTWEHSEGAENRQICPVDSLHVTSVQLLGSDATTHMLLRGHVLPKLTGPKGNTNKEDKPDILSYRIHKKQQMREA